MEEKRKPICKFGTNCTRTGCSFIHPDGKRSITSSILCKFGTSCKRSECSYLHPDGKTATTTASICKFGTNCTRLDCSFLHPDGKKSMNTSVCKFGIRCTRSDCSLVHPDRKESTASDICKFGSECTRQGCSFVHPDGKKLSLESYGTDESGSESEYHSADDTVEDCPSLHPNKFCWYAESCYNINCPYLHSSKRQICSEGKDCENFECTLNHPPSRGDIICQFKSMCYKIDCQRRHPPGHKVCHLGEICFDIMCCLTHPLTRPKICPQKINCPNTDCILLHPQNWDPSAATSQESNYLKSVQMRQQERIKAALPILNSQVEFIDQLKREKVVVVTAETGSGKTTQLPQYCAEAFSGLTVCTQPRAVAAISIAQRMAYEFDGTAAGKSIGYTVGGNSVQGQRIMLMTDSSLVRIAQNDVHLKHISVLIIDEAHERSLNTDMVLGIAKLVRKKRPDDFYVVIASATIDPKPFIEFFFGGGSCCQPLKVPGRTFPVDVEYANDIDDEDDDLLKSGYLISKVIKTLEMHQEGHCLVFLPGSNEVDSALRQFTKEANPQWIGLPLYGSLPPEEQSRILNFDDSNGTLRMVVFCTNIAETSLTVPNVRLVIDTGLAKEARYDPKRRMTVLELVHISKSSAEQRKGRAGRTAAGHCIRLYKYERLTRQHITPEILRSSLDLVVLQISKIGYDPRTFPFIDAPEAVLIDSSSQTLHKFNCLDTMYKITPRGSVFSELPFDPRLSHFVVSAHEQYGKGELASNIAAILSAPGSIFFMGGGKTGRNEVKKRMADESAKIESDLLYLQSIYHSWFTAGSVDPVTMTCNTCTQKIPVCLFKRNSGCRSCRICHSNEQGLNNKIMEIVLKNVTSVMTILERNKIKKLQGAHTKVLSRDIDTDNMEVIGRCLLEGFEDQLCQMILQHNPKAGAYVVSSVMKAHLSNSTALAIARGKKGAPPFFISMLVTQIPNGLTIADHAHPIKESWLTQSQLEQVSKRCLQMLVCYSHDNLNKRFLTHLQKQLTVIPINEACNGLEIFISCYYDSDKNAVCVSAPKEIGTHVKCCVSEIIDKKLKEEREYEQVVLIGEGSAYATIIGGLRIHALEQIGLALRVKYVNPPVKSSDEFKTWILEKTKLSDQTIKWYHYYPSQYKGTKHKEAFAIAVFRDEIAAEKASNINLEQGSAIQRSSTANKEQGQKLLLSVKMDESMLRSQLDQLLPNSVHVTTVQPQTFSLRLRNIPLDDITRMNISEQLYNTLDIELTNPEINVVHDQAFMTLPNALSKAAYLRAELILKQSLLGNARFQKQITTKKGYQKLIQVSLDTTIVQSACIISLVFAKTEDAEQFVINNHNRWPDSKLYAEAVVYISHPELYDIPSLAHSVAEKYSVKFKIQKANNAIRFTGSSPQQVGLCAQALQAYVCPLKIHLGERKQQLFITELYSSKRLLQDASKCGVFVEPHTSEVGGVFGLTIYGPQSKQGQFMSTISEHCNAFEGRYDCVRYDPITASIFQIPSAGSKRLQALQKDITGAKLVFVKHLDSIEILVNPDIHESQRGNMLMSCREAIQKIVTELCGAERKILDQSCVKCKVYEGMQLSICGHPCCRKCRTILCEEYIKKPTPHGICCPICSELISIRDIRDSRVFDEACITSAKEFLKTKPKHCLTFCPQKNCSALLSRSMDYGQCRSCQSFVCVMCETVDNHLHIGKNCADFKYAAKLERRGLCFESLFSSAKSFVNSNWSYKLGDPQRIDENPGIKLGCPAMIKYCNAMLTVGGLALPSTLFAWHGTSSEAAIQSICHNGFDPTRRSGQAYGTGEYFGQTAEVSHGYANGTSRMIVAQLVQGPHTTKHGNFCYVVNNPTDWKMSFCLPVLVVTYGTALCPVTFTTNYPPQKLPLHLFGSDDPPEVDDIEHPVNDQQLKISNNWISPYRWHWQTDEGGFQAYTDTINVLIEEAFSIFQGDISSPEYVTPPIIRFVDDLPQVYVINFPKMEQMNMKSKYIRKISRQEVNVQLFKGSTWQYNDGIAWIPYDLLTQGKIEAAFRDYTTQRGPSKISLQFPGRPEIYDLCFAQGQQINKQTGAVRIIRRV